MNAYLCGLSTLYYILEFHKRTTALYSGKSFQIANKDAVENYDKEINLGKLSSTSSNLSQ